MFRYLLYIILRTFTTSFNKIIKLSTKLHQVFNLITHLIIASIVGDRIKYSNTYGQQPVRSYLHCKHRTC